MITGCTGELSRGPVGLLILLRKKRATLAFLHARHSDLRGAIERSGVNLGDAQETGHRVLRDAERAVFRQHERAFPELQQLPASWQEWVLWRQAGECPLWEAGPALVPAWLARKLGDQDGLFASASRQYRDSMNKRRPGRATAACPITPGTSACRSRPACSRRCSCTMRSACCICSGATARPESCIRATGPCIREPSFTSESGFRDKLRLFLEGDHTVRT